MLGDRPKLNRLPTEDAMNCEAIPMLIDLFNWLRRLIVRTETSHPSQWYTAFRENKDCYVVLHLMDDRRLYGWPFGWPSQQDKDHLQIREAEWLVGEERTELEGVKAILIPAREVRAVEFVKGEQPTYIRKEWVMKKKSRPAPPPPRTGGQTPKPPNLVKPAPPPAPPPPPMSGGS